MAPNHIDRGHGALHPCGPALRDWHASRPACPIRWIIVRAWRVVWTLVGSEVEGPRRATYAARMVEIETARLRLRPARPGDLEALHAVLSHPDAMRYWSTPPHDSLDLTRDWLAATIGIPPGVGEDFVVEHVGHVIGKAGLYRFPEVGFILHPDHWGRGLATEALGAVLDRAFRVHGLLSVIADVDPRNTASLRLLTRLGFQETGRRANTWNVDGVWCDSVDLALLLEDWRQV